MSNEIDERALAALARPSSICPLADLANDDSHDGLVDISKWMREAEAAPAPAPAAAEGSRPAPRHRALLVGIAIGALVAGGGAVLWSQGGVARPAEGPSPAYPPPAEPDESPVGTAGNKAVSPRSERAIRPPSGHRAGSDPQGAPPGTASADPGVPPNAGEPSRTRAPGAAPAPPSAGPSSADAPPRPAEQGPSDDRSPANADVPGSAGELPPKRSLDQMLDQALGVNRPPQRPSSSPDGPGASGSGAEANSPGNKQESGAAVRSDVPDRSEVARVLGALLPAMRRCADEQVGLANALILLKNDGTVGSVSISGQPFGGSPQGACMEQVIRRAQFSPFRQTTFRITYPFAIRPGP